MNGKYSLKYVVMPRSYVQDCRGIAVERLSLWNLLLSMYRATQGNTPYMPPHVSLGECYHYSLIEGYLPTTGLVVSHSRVIEDYHLMFISRYKLGLRILPLV